MIGRTRTGETPFAPVGRIIVARPGGDYYNSNRSLEWYTDQARRFGRRSPLVLLDHMLLTSEQQALLLDLARGAIRCALSPHPVPHLPEDPQLHQPAGCFVSLHELRTHRLRGCVGRLDAKGPLAQT